VRNQVAELLLQTGGVEKENLVRENHKTMIYKLQHCVEITSQTRIKIKVLTQFAVGADSNVKAKVGKVPT
jgi:hypothetical protein